MIPFVTEIESLLGILVILTALYMQGQSFVDPTIRAIVVQSLLISALFGVLAVQTGTLELFFMAVLTFIMSSITIPRIMLYQVRKFKHSVRGSGTGQKIPALIILGVLTVILGYALFKVIIAPFVENGEVSVAFTLLFLGFLLIISRRNALVQMTGYVEEENAVLLAGALLVPTIPLLIEFAVVLDIFGVVIIGAILSAQRDVLRTMEPEDLDQLRG